MRNLSPASLAAILATSGQEPTIVVRIYWGGSSFTSYCDRKFEAEGLVGKLISISGIEDVVDINSAASSVNLSLTLDDTDGSIKSIYNTVDIHKVYVQVLQWFTSIPLSEAFIIFEGEISSPIIWSEGARTLKFDVVTRLEDREVGFSAEEGAFDYMPSSLIGKAWPVIFGKVAGGKLLAMNETPTAVLSSGFGVVNDIVWRKELDNLADAIRQANLNSRSAYILGVQQALIASHFKGGAFFPDDPQQALQYDQAAQQYYEQSNQYALERINLELEYGAKKAEYDFQKSLEFRTLPIAQSNLPTGNYSVEIGNFTATATVVGNVITLANLAEKIDPNKPPRQNNYDFLMKQQYRPVERFDQQNEGQKFIWIDGGTQIKIFGFPRIFIASIGFVNVLNLWATNKYGRAVVPRNWYVIEHTFFGSLPVTRIVFPSPLESYPGEWQAGDVEIDAIGSLGSNAVDIMTWAIVTFSGFTYDNPSFVYARTKVDPLPMNFILKTRMNVVSFLKEVAFQARCAIWLNDRKFFIRFLPEEQTPVETITDADVEVNSLTLTSDDTEKLVTKFVATYRERENQPEESKIVYRYNIRKYGTLEETYDFFCYTNALYVQKVAEFWMIRKSNSWKRVQLKVFLNKLRIEAFDTVTLNLTENIASYGPVNGLVTKSVFDPDDDSLNLEIWLPVRLGEMTPYAYAFPGSTTAIYPRNDDPNIVTGNPWQDARGEIVPLQFVPAQYQVTLKLGGPWLTAGTGLPGNQDTPAGQSGDFVVQLDPNEINPFRPPGLANFNDGARRDVRPLTVITNTPSVPNAFYGNAVLRKGNNLYTCTVYVNGFAGEPVSLDVKIGTIRDNTTLPNGYPLVVYRTVWKDSSGLTQFEYWAQPAIWAPPSQES